MKKSIYLLVLVSFIMYTACESPDHTQPILNGEQNIETRGECDECPASNQCCCAVRLATGQLTASLTICGSVTGGGLSNCSGTPGGTCSSFVGITYTIGLGMLNPRDPFCSLLSSSFSITNNDDEEVNIEISCQADLDEAQWFPVTIPAFTTIYFVNNGSCFISLC